ncbi:hypothetical protein KFZ56_18965 [Virgibacillus sp. NKC19-3]|uniref:DUF5957 family protein n=1 Tax=Virgibacillus saliphilus TaxID=2831674 RepID=UPI001C9AF3F6|nr:DUF5957 family protein [Virgibacillus sp. NKC19-3]MBY7145103.1 hypothetical protein [Virgibacillus sp. NKC19-3]
MRVFIAIIVGLIGGFILGIALSSFIGVLGMLLFNEPIGIKFLSYFTAIICAVVVPIIDQKNLKSGN